MSFVFNQFKHLETTASGVSTRIDLVNDTSIKLILVGSTHSLDVDDSFVDPSLAAGSELNGTGYVGGYGGSGRKAVSVRAISRDDANDRAEFTFAPVTWSSINAGTAAGAVLIRERAGTGDTMSELIAFIDSGGFPVVTNGGDLTFTPNVEGVLQLT